MEIEEIISEYGLDRALSSFFPNLSGIDISKVIYDKESQKSNPLTYLTSDVDGDWYFAIGSMPMIFKSFSKDKYEIELKKLLYLIKFQLMINTIKKVTMILNFGMVMVLRSKKQM